MTVKEASQQKTVAKMADTLAEARTGLFRATLLFGSIAVALSLIVVPAADRHAKETVAERSRDVDPMVTGSTPDGARRYVVRRSVLDIDRTGPCLFFPDGSERGAC
ncbi:MAG: hypothetical protein H7Y08_12425 [Rhizobiaceae bacterium]|nr:hypothetical protein [Rhizobiaceae bacterium]